MADTQRPMNLIATAVSPHRFVILALGLATLAVPLTGCDKPDTSANEEPPAETLVDRSTQQGVELKAEDLLNPQQKKALASGPGAIEYPAAFSGKPVKTTKDDDGLIIDDFVVGKGSEATSEKILKIHYQGFLTNGYKFDDSKPRGKAPIRF